MYGPSRKPDYPAAFNSVEQLSLDELKTYLEDDDDTKLDEFVKSLDQVKRLYKEKEVIMTSNKSLAEYNISQQPIIEERKELWREKTKEANELVEQVRSVCLSLEKKAEHMSPDTLLSLLEAASAEAEEESENLAKKFLDGKEENLDEFIETFQEARKLSHFRRIKVDKMKEIVAKIPSSNTAPVNTNYPPYGAAGNEWNVPPRYPPAAALPYPTQPTNTFMQFPLYPPIP